MTDSKLIPFEAQVSQAIREAAHGEDDGPVSPGQLMAELEAVLGKPALVAKALVPERAVRPPNKKPVDARSPDTLGRAALSLLSSAGDSNLSPERAVLAAMERAGLTKDMIPQMLESPDWAGTVARLCQQYLYVTHLPKIVAAQITKAGMGDTAAAKHLAEMFGRNELDSLDEQTRMLAEADPATRTRHTKAIIEDLQRFVDQTEGQGADKQAVEAARAKAIQDAMERKEAQR